MRGLVGLSPHSNQSTHRERLLLGACAQPAKARWTQRFSIEPIIVRTRSAELTSPLRALQDSKKWTKSHVASLTSSTARVHYPATTRRRHHPTAPCAGPGAHRRPSDGYIHSCSVQSVVLKKICSSPNTRSSRETAEDIVDALTNNLRTPRRRPKPIERPCRATPAS